MSTSVQQQEELTTILVGRWEQACRKLADLAGEIPADRYDSQPVAGVRTCSEGLRHVAFWNRYVADSLRGRKADDSGNELSVTDYSTKASIVEALNLTSAEAAAALREHHAPVASKETELIMAFVEHTSEHYGQLAVYARLMGIVPPVSGT